MRKMLPTLLACLAGAVALPAAAAQRWALCIGVDRCKAVGELKVCAADARALKSVLEQVGYPSGSVRLLADDSPDMTSWPTSSNVEREIENLARVAESDDSILLFFSGHGVTRDGEGYLVPVDGDARRAIALSWVKSQLAASKARDKVLILDACHAGAAKAVNGIAPSLKAGAGLVMLLSCAAEQVSWPDEAAGHSVFSRYLIEGLSGKAADKDRNVTARQLAEFVRTNVKAWTFGSGKPLQTPLLACADDSAVIGRCPQGNVTIPAATPAPPTAVPPPVVQPSQQPRLSGPAQGQPWTVPNLGLALVCIQPNSFQIGSDNGGDDEKPVHSVRISRGFWLGKYEVTNGEYQAFLGASGYDGKGDADDDYLRHHRDWAQYASTGDRYPVVAVSWNNAAAFCRWLTERERGAGRLPAGYEYRLPTEAEWEYACRAGTTGDYAGNLDDMAWYDKNSGGKTHEVGTKKPNAWGLYDMHGNVWEWCLDWYDAAYYGRSPGTDPVNAQAASYRVGRGGGWGHSPGGLRSAYRIRLRPEDAYGDRGFRVCLAPQSAESAVIGRCPQGNVTIPPPAPPPVAPPPQSPVRTPQLRVPDGFRAVAGAADEPYTDTGWAKDIVHEATGIEMAYIPARSSTMGSPESEIGRDNDEVQHRVTLTKGFYMGKYEVTQDQWQKVMGNNPSNFTNAGGNAPVERVSWDDCQSFCGKLGTGFRLPTEAEWEYACRAGTTTALNNGRELTSTTGRCQNLDEVAWYDETSGSTTHPVGSKKPNAWSLYDMHGNVLEWCQDWDGPYPTGAVTDPAGPGSGSYRVVRGGGWYDDARHCRAANRLRFEPGNRIADLGCRLVRTVP